jgi:hypothetical protein
MEKAEVPICVGFALLSQAKSVKANTNTKVKIAIEEDEEPWDDIDEEVTEDIEKEITESIDLDYIKEENK